MYQNQNFTTSFQRLDILHQCRAYHEIRLNRENLLHEVMAPTVKNKRRADPPKKELLSQSKYDTFSIQ